MITYLIIDDEHIAHDIIKGYCDMLPNMKLMKHCYDAIEALEYLNNHTVDLLFLDLNMPKLRGFDFLKTLASPPKVIVTTAYSEFALESYELNVIDYLLKPIRFERFLKAVNKINNTTNEKPSNVITNTTTSEKRLFLRSNKKHTQVNVDEILYVEAAGNYTKVVVLNETITIREKISYIIDMLPKEDFLQVHKSFAVAIKHIKSIEANKIIIGDYSIPVGKLYKLNVNKLIQ